MPDQDLTIAFSSDEVLDREKRTSDTVEFDHLQLHFDKYLYTLRSALDPNSTANGPQQPTAPLPSTDRRRQPSRNTAAAAIAVKLAARKVSESRFFKQTEDRIRPKKPQILPVRKSEDPPVYLPKRSWGRDEDNMAEGPLNSEDSLVDALRGLDGLNLDQCEYVPAPLKSVWNMPSLRASGLKDLEPERVPLRAKLTKRCAVCNRSVLRPEPKAQSLKYKVKSFAPIYIPSIELGNRRRLSNNTADQSGDVSRRMGALPRIAEEKQTLDTPLRCGETVSKPGRHTGSVPF
jgi:dynactin-4